jgi:hypothetical protein
VLLKKKIVSEPGASVPYSSSYVAGMFAVGLMVVCVLMAFWKAGGTCMYVFFYQISSGFVCDDFFL